MNKDQKVFYRKGHNLWIVEMLISLGMIVSSGLLWHHSDKTADEMYAASLLLMFFALIFIVIAVLTLISDRTSTFTVSTEGVTFYRKIQWKIFRRRHFIPWSAIQAIRYDKYVSYSRMDDHYATLLVNMVMDYYDDQRSPGTLAVPLSQLHHAKTTSEDFKNALAHYGKNHVPVVVKKRQGIPAVNETLYYDDSIKQAIAERSFIVDGGAFGIGVIGLGLFGVGIVSIALLLLIFGVGSMCIYIAIRPRKPRYSVIDRKIALRFTEEGLQDDWLMHKNIVIPWADIDDIDIATSPHLWGLSERCLMVHFKDDARYKSSLSRWQRLVYHYRTRFNYPSICVCEHLQDYSLEALEEALKDQLNASCES